MKIRIISGHHRARSIKAPVGKATHPMSEKIRGAIFNMLGDINGLTVLDAFGGSGALGLEAVSRGAASATIIEQNTKAYDCIQENINTLGLHEQVYATRANINTWLDNKKNTYFDIVFCDPPYNQVRPELIEKIAVSALHKDGILVLSLPITETFALAKKHYLLQAHKQYGNASLYIYKKIS